MVRVYCSKVLTLAAATADQLSDWLQCIERCRVREDVVELSIWQAARRM